MLKPPRPGSLGDSTALLPPPSCSPFSGKSSWNTNTDSLAGGSGVFCVTTVTAGAAGGGGGGGRGARGGPPAGCAPPPARAPCRLCAPERLVVAPGSNGRGDRTV